MLPRARCSITVKHMHDVRLTDAQVAEVRRRRADPNR